MIIILCWFLLHPVLLARNLDGCYFESNSSESEDEAKEDKNRENLIQNNNRLGSWLAKPDGEETNSNDNQNEHVEEIELTAEEMEERQKRAQEIMDRNKKEYSKEEIEELDD